MSANWFEENHEGGLKVSYKISETLFEAESPFQKIKVLQSETYGRILVIDDCVMVTERDEFVYHEMMAHIPTMLMDSPKRALIIGGGDGGTMRELLRHSCYEEVILCEIDGLVVEAAKKFLPSLSSGFADSRAKVVIQDGIQYVKDLPQASFDLIVVDSTDPIGPGEGLFTKDFYSDVARALRPKGLMVCQSESLFYDQKIHDRIQGNVGSAFPWTRPYIGYIPSYPEGLWSWTIGSKEPIDPNKLDGTKLNSFAHELSYLNPEMAKAAFAIPQFFVKQRQAKT